MDSIVDFVTGASPYNAELRTFGMAFQGAMTVRSGRNKDKSMDWFYAFCCTLLTAFAGGLFGFVWMGKPTSLITGGDVTLTLTAIAFVLATYTPMDIGYKLGNNLAVKIITTVFAQLFRALGMLAFINTATAEVSASKYYPTPILGPVLYGVLLGNMGAFFSKGFDGHLQQGCPFPIQNGSIIGFLYQIYANDTDGVMGRTLRSMVHSTGIQGSMDDKTFATFCASLFMIVCGVLMLPEFFGGAWNPFVAVMLRTNQLLSLVFSKVMVAVSVPVMALSSFWKRFLFTFSHPSYSPWIGLLLRLFLAWFFPFLLDDGRLVPGVSYTDIDFSVFTDAARYIQQGRSPYDRHTYRYTPFLAAGLARFPDPEVGRYLFCVADALCGWIILSLRQAKEQRQQNTDGSKVNNDYDWKAGLQDALWWLYNPLAIYICTRGSSESITVLLPVLATYWTATLHERQPQPTPVRAKKKTKNLGSTATQQKTATWMQVVATGVCHGVAVHSKLYPIIYSLSYMAYFAAQRQTQSTTAIPHPKTNQFPWTKPAKLVQLAMLWIRRLFWSPLPLVFLSTFLATFVALTWLGVYFYDTDALEEGLLYHFGRVDHRHNYSMYWYWIYLARARMETKVSATTTMAATSSLSKLGKFLLLPQAFLLAFISVGMAPHQDQLGLALFMQTFLFVCLNKVITAQYFTWYLCLLPLCSNQIQFQSPKVLLALGLVGLSIITWLGSAYMLEMQGMAFHRIVWACSLAYFFANVNVMRTVLQSRPTTAVQRFNKENYPGMNSSSIIFKKKK